MPATDYIRANAMELDRVLSAKELYHVPIFQRPYVWSRPTIDALFENIQEIDLAVEDDTHFIGAIFVADRSHGGAGRPREYWLIDGQQRITTLYLMLLHLAVLAAKAEEQMLVNKVERYLFEQLPDSTRQPRLMPTVADSRQFRDALLTYTATNKINLPPDSGGKEGYMSKAFAHIRKRVSSMVLEQSRFNLARAEELFRKLLERLIVVNISLSDSDDPTQVFHTLNATGQKLEIVDLARNEIFRRLKDDTEYTKSRAVYDAHWQPLERRFETSDLFNDYFFPYALAAKPTAKASKLLPALREQWTNDTPEAIISKLEAHAGVYLAFNSSNAAELTGLRLEPILQAMFFRLRRMGSGLPSSTYPFLFNLHAAWLAKTISSETYLANLQLLESFLIRRFFAGYEPTGLHAVFKGMWKETLGAPARFVDVITKSRTIDFPDDGEFKRNVAERSLYGRSLATYVVMEYERSFTDGDTISDDFQARELVTLDHVMPQTLGDGWSVKSDEHVALVDVWANLVPLSRNANSQKRNAPWIVVRDFYRNDAMFKSARACGTSENWDAKAIRARAQILASWAVQRWPKAVLSSEAALQASSGNAPSRDNG